MQQRIRASVLCLHQNRLLAIQMRDPRSGECFWSLPGGAVEQAESFEDCAIRETLEETGYRVRLTGLVGSSDYLFHWAGVDYKCTTHWFTAALTSTQPDPVNDADYLIRTEWLPWPDSRSMFNYHPSLLDAVSLLDPVE